MQIVTKGKKDFLISFLTIEKNTCGTNVKSEDFFESGTGILGNITNEKIDL